MKQSHRLAAIVAACVLAACSSPKPAGPRIDVTIGQQLIELKEARDVGALSEKEYARQKKALIDSIQ
jgi:hypothetical protein